jgi:hypothetical protein
VNSAACTPEEIVRRAREIYDRDIRVGVEPEHKGKYVAIDVETGNYEIGPDYHELSKGMLARKPDAVLSVLRIGYPAAGRIGGHLSGSKQC